MRSPDMRDVKPALLAVVVGIFAVVEGSTAVAAAAAAAQVDLDYDQVEPDVFAAAAGNMARPCSKRHPRPTVSRISAMKHTVVVFGSHMFVVGRTVRLVVRDIGEMSDGLSGKGYSLRRIDDTSSSEDD